MESTIDSEPSRWRWFSLRNRIKLNLFHISAILCLQTLCYCVVTSIDTYISLLPSKNNTVSYGQDINGTCSQIDNETSVEESDQSVTYERNIANSIPAIVMTYALAIFMPFVVIVYLNLSVYWWYFNGFVLGLFGGAGIIDFVTYLIIVDITTKENRSVWFVQLYAMRKGFEAIITFAIFCFVERHGYIPLFWCGFVLQAIAIIATWLFYDLSLYNHTNLRGYHQIGLNFDIITIFYGNRRPTAQKVTVLLTIIAYCFYSFIHSMSSTFLFALAHYPICWSEMLINIYKLVKGISLAVFSTLGYHLLAWLTKSNDELICAIGYIFSLFASLWLIFAQYSWQVFSTSVIYALTNFQSPLTLSILAAWLKPCEINIAFIFIIVINQLITSFGDPFFQNIYMKTSKQHTATVLYINAALCVIPLILNICIHIVKRRTLQRPSEITDERTSLLANVNGNENSSQTTDDAPSPISVTLFSIGNLSFIINIGSAPQPNTETNQSVVDA
ncbi:unnamed protein product [Adineta ricciae]|uniref:Uncharacterized protein n=1 Tax=Adineta ricciae TaxID=249248 RepID=A0A814XXH4_ADIRI|nr:unnamed protein product [Adineta ricciae]